MMDVLFQAPTPTEPSHEEEPVEEPIHRPEKSRPKPKKLDTPDLSAQDLLLEKTIEYRTMIALHPELIDVYQATSQLSSDTSVLSVPVADLLSQHGGANEEDDNHSDDRLASGRWRGDDSTVQEDGSRTLQPRRALAKEHDALETPGVGLERSSPECNVDGDSLVSRGDQESQSAGS